MGLRLEMHPDLRMSKSDVDRLSLLEFAHRHAVLDQIDAAKDKAAKALK